MPPFRLSAGILLYRRQNEMLQVFLVHPGGPFWAARDHGAWQIPKGNVEPGEEPADTARREFREEVGSDPGGTLEPLGRVRQSGGKWVEAFAVAGDIDATNIVSTYCEMEWPPRSGKQISIPEVDRAEWFTLDAARIKMLASQQPLLDRLQEIAGA
ncbi:MAG: NUDIX domain-containing protein [Pseudomonadota bacterium]